MRSFHLTYRKDEKHWCLLEVGVGDLHAFKKKGDAVKLAREIVKDASGSLRIHKKNGQIQEERTYGDDPGPPSKG